LPVRVARCAVGASQVRRPSGDSAPLAPNQRRRTHAVELAREGVPLNVIQRQLGHANPGTTSIYLQDIDIALVMRAPA